MNMWKWTGQKADDRFTQILLWSFSKRDRGFSWAELQRHFDLTDSESEWIQHVFLTGNDSDRKYIEHLRYVDEGTRNEHIYTLNEKGTSAALSYLEQKATRQMSLWATVFSGVALFIGGAALFVSIWTGGISQKALNLSIEPQLDFYLQAINTDEYIFGVDNTGTVPISNLLARYTIANMDKCLESEDMCGGWSVSMDMDFDVPHLLHGESATSSALSAVSDNRFKTAISIWVEYDRTIDKKKIKKSMVFFIAGSKVYSLSEVKDMPSWQPFISGLRNASGRNSFFNQKIYWRD